VYTCDEGYQIVGLAKVVCQGHSANILLPLLLLTNYVYSICINVEGTFRIIDKVQYLQAASTYSMLMPTSERQGKLRILENILHGIERLDQGHIHPKVEVRD